MLAVIGAVFYFGWPVIEAILILIPLPDPSEAKESIIGLWNRVLKAGRGDDKPKSGDYQSNFESAPGTLNESDDEEEDIGKNFNKGLDYDSDEKDESQDE